LTDNPFGSLTWVGTYGPMSRFDQAADKGIEIMKKNRLPPTIVSRPIKQGHFGVLRFITTFNSQDEEEVARVRGCNVELVTMALEQGFIPYKTPAWAMDQILAGLGQETHSLMKRLHAALDPVGIMSQGRWGLDQG
jgi:hypothetical protein